MMFVNLEFQPQLWKGLLPVTLFIMESMPICQVGGGGVGWRCADLPIWVHRCFKGI